MEMVALSSLGSLITVGPWYFEQMSQQPRIFPLVLKVIRIKLTTHCMFIQSERLLTWETFGCSICVLILQSVTLVDLGDVIFAYNHSSPSSTPDLCWDGFLYWGLFLS